MAESARSVRASKSPHAHPPCLRVRYVQGARRSSRRLGASARCIAAAGLPLLSCSVDSRSLDIVTGPSPSPEAGLGSGMSDTPDTGAGPGGAGAAGCDAGGACEGTPLEDVCADLPLPSPVEALSPMRGAYTGSLHAPAASLSLRPTLGWSSSSTSCGQLTYEVQLDDSCQPGELGACGFTSPEVDTASAQTSFQPASELPVSRQAPVGAFYAWRVRACDGAARCSSYSAPAYLHVGRTPQDLDGDGFADVLVNVGGTALDVYLGSAGFDSQADLQLPLSSGALGIRHAGDLDGDGFGDLALVATSLEVCASSGSYPEIIFGGADLAAPRTQALCTVAGSPSVSFQTGHLGDLDGDGFADLGLAREFQDSRFVVLRGGASVQGVAEVDLDISIEGAAGTYPHVQGDRTFDGAGDFNGDGYADVLVSGRGISPALLETRLLLGAATLPRSASASFSFSLDQAETNGPLVTRVGDLNRDGRDDWAIGIGMGSTDPGRVAVLSGAAAPPTQPTRVVPAAPAIAGVSRAIDFDRDGELEVFVAPSGELLLLRGSGDLATAPSSGQLSANRRLSSADHNGDGREDLLLQSTGTGTFTVRWVAAAASFTVTPIALLPFVDGAEAETRDIIY